MELNQLRNINLVFSVILSTTLYFYMPYIVVGIVEYIFKNYQLYFVPRITIFEILAIGFIPFWSYLSYSAFVSIKKILITNLIIVTSLISSIYIGGLIAVQFDNRISPLLPEYLVTEVFPFYWSVVVLFGISTPLLLFRPWRKRN